MSLLRSFHAPALALQTPFDVAVVMPSVLRPSIAAALDSIFAQRFPGRIQVLIGLDRDGAAPPPDLSAVEAACADIPDHCAVQLLYPGYSTSVRHGGLSAARDGGTLRGADTGQATSLYTLDPEDGMHPVRLQLMGGAYEDAT